LWRFWVQMKEMAPNNAERHKKVDNKIAWNKKSQGKTRRRARDISLTVCRGACVFLFFFLSFCFRLPHEQPCPAKQVNKQMLEALQQHHKGKKY